MTGETVFLSVVVPAFKKEAQLGRLLESLTTPAYADVEVIVVDDASPDGTARVAAEWESRNPAVRLVRHATNGGVHTARNTGLDAARGTWIAFIDADDYLLPDGLTRVLETLRAAETEDVVFFGFVSDRGEATGFTHPGHHSISDVFTGQTFLSEKNSFLCVRALPVRAHNSRWYYTNLDSLFWREIVYHARGQRALFVTPPVGIYDTTTEGSLKKLRRDPSHALRHANAKVDAVLKFLTRVEGYLVTSPTSARAVVSHLLLGNLKHVHPKRRYLAPMLRHTSQLPLGFVMRSKLLAALILPSSPRFWNFLGR
jgi:glycosyltransferase involved in cell wall biosynthesis